MTKECQWCEEDVAEELVREVKATEDTMMTVCNDCYYEHDLGQDEAAEENDDAWTYPAGALLLRVRDDTIWHVTARVRDVDDGTRYYRVEDATHTTIHWTLADDVEPAPDATLPGTHVLLRESMPDGAVKPVELDLVRHLRDA